MAETRMAIGAGIALLIMGAAQFVRHQGGLSTTVSTVLVVIEIVAIVAGVAGIFTWARLREAQKRRDTGGSS